MFLRVAMTLTALAPAVALAEGKEWEVSQLSTTADLSADGWQPIGSVGFNGPEGRSTLVSFWKTDGRNVARCVTVFDASFEQVSDDCFFAVSPLP